MPTRESEVNAVNSLYCSEVMSSLARVRNSGSLFQSNVCNLFLPGISLLSVLSRCPLKLGVRKARVDCTSVGNCIARGSHEIGQRRVILPQCGQKSFYRFWYPKLPSNDVATEPQLISISREWPRDLHVTLPFGRGDLGNTRCNAQQMVFK